MRESVWGVAGAIIFVAAIVASTYLVPRCAPTSHPGPTIGGVILIAGCPK